MKPKITYLNIDGYDYPMSYSLFVSQALLRKYDKEDLDNLEKNLNGAQSLDLLIFLLCQLINSGCEYMNLFRLYPTDKKFNLDENGKIYRLSEQELALCLDMSEDSMRYISNKIKECMNKSQTKDVTAQVKSNNQVGKKKKRHY